MRFDQVKVLANDVARLSSFYQRALHCEPLSEVVEFDDPVLCRGLGVGATRIAITWLAFPEADDDSPVLEIYGFPGGVGSLDWEWNAGQAQLAFQVDDIEAVRNRVLEEGGRMVGALVNWSGPSGKPARFGYLADPEGNIIDLWSRVES